MCRKDGVQVCSESLVAKEERQKDGPQEDVAGAHFSFRRCNAFFGT